jgi:hypothetical protein
MKLSHVITVLLLLFGLMLFTTISITGRPISDAQAQMMLREPTPLEMQMAIRETSRANSGSPVNWLVIFLVSGVLGTMAYLSIGDRTTKLLRAWKSARKPYQPPVFERAEIQEIPTAQNVPQLPAHAEQWTE